MSEHVASERSEALPRPLPDDRLRAIGEAIDQAATAALADELACFPKPGLVSFVDAGAHDDMDADTFLTSIDALRGYFADQAWLGAAAAPFEHLRQRGLSAEVAMLAATRGINTHRGAIFTLGLLAAAAGYLAARRQAPRMNTLSLVVRGLWGASIGSGVGLDPASHGQRAACRDDGRGARAEAAAGFPVLCQEIWPRFVGGGPQPWLDALFAGMAALHDTNIVHRGGPQGLAWTQQAARDFLAAGGAAADGEVRAAALHQAFCQRRISPGGSADLLAAAFFVARLQRMEQA